MNNFLAYQCVGLEPVFNASNNIWSRNFRSIKNEINDINLGQSKYKQLFYVGAKVCLFYSARLEGVLKLEQINEAGLCL